MSLKLSTVSTDVESSVSSDAELAHREIVLSDTNVRWIIQQSSSIECPCEGDSGVHLYSTVDLDH